MDLERRGADGTRVKKKGVESLLREVRRVLLPANANPGAGRSLGSLSHPRGHRACTNSRLHAVLSTALSQPVCTTAGLQATMGRKYLSLSPQRDFEFFYENRWVFSLLFSPWPSSPLPHKTGPAGDPRGTAAVWPSKLSFTLSKAANAVAWLWPQQPWG